MGVLKLRAVWISLLVLGLALLSTVVVNFVRPQAATAVHASDQVVRFNLVASPGIQANCLPHASGRVVIEREQLNDVMTVSVKGLVPNTGYDLFVIQLPNKPFGVSWYQSDLQTDKDGDGSVTVQGIFNKETFSVSPGGTTTFTPTHQFHLGLWFNNPQVPFNKGCEPTASAPIVTPFNGEQHAGIQVLNTGNFADNAGPLSQVKP